MKYKPQHSRLLFIDRKIGEGSFPNCSSLAAEWEVSRKTIQRDIDYMRDMLDAPIDYVAAKRGFHYSEANFQLPALALKESDLFAIYLAEEILSQYQGTPVYDTLAQIFAKIEDSLPAKVDANCQQEQALFSFLSSPLTTIDPVVWRDVFLGLRERRQLSFTYHNPGQPAASRRHLDPYHAVRFEGDWYVIGYCHKRQEVRTFSLARINEVQVTTSSFPPPSDFNFHKLAKSRFGLHWGQEETRVVVRFQAGSASYIRERNWHPSQEIKEHGDGSITLSLTVGHLLELKKWLLSWGSQAQVLKPSSLAEEIADEARAMLAAAAAASP
ncbi:MAG: WYL domain-containing transcriptional regulator [Thermodesulfobacteriota bacterium]